MNFAALLMNMTEGEAATAIEQELEVSPENIKRVRISQNKKLAEAAKEIEIAHTTLSRYENGKIQSPTPANLEKMKDWIMSQ